MTHSDVWHDSCICVTWLIFVCDMTHSYVWHDSFRCVTWLIHMCDITHSYVWHDSFICVATLMHTCDITHAYVWHDSCIHVTWLIHTCDMTDSYAWHDAFLCVTWLRHVHAIAGLFFFRRDEDQVLRGVHNSFLYRVRDSNKGSYVEFVTHVCAYNCRAVFEAMKTKFYVVFITHSYIESVTQTRAHM